MIIYDLACPHGHRFEGWFASGDDFAAQKARELVRCPICDDAGVAIVPSAKVVTPRVGAAAGAHGHAGSRRGAAGRTGSRGQGERAPDPNRHGDAPDMEADDAVPANFASGLPAEMLSKLREIVRAAEDVGRRFPEEARRIHYDEAPARPIRGQASREETEELREEGIDVSPLPPFLTGDEH